MRDVLVQTHPTLGMDGEEQIQIGRKRASVQPTSSSRSKRRRGSQSNVASIGVGQLESIKLGSGTQAASRFDSDDEENGAGQSKSATLLQSRFDSDSDEEEPAVQAPASRFDSDEDSVAGAAVGNVASRFDSDDDEEEVRPNSSSSQPPSSAADQAQRTVFRDASGKKIDLESATKNRALEKARADAEERARAVAARTGAAQLREAEERAKAAASNREEGIVEVRLGTGGAGGGQSGSGIRMARLGETASSERARAEVVRAEDPMAPLLAMQTGAGDAASSQSRPQLKRRWTGMPPPNRFGILPGALWDGVDRSNGFERRVMAQAAAKRSKSAAAYRMGAAGM